MRAWWVMLCAAMLAGCADDVNEPVETTEPDMEGPDVVATNATLPPLMGSLSADRVNGTAPLLVNFTVAADGATNVTWSLETNGTVFANGTAVPAIVNHTFDAGLWNVTLRVSDGARTNATTLQINATALAAVSERVPVLLEEVTASGTIGGPYLLTNDPTMAHQCPGFNAGESGLGCVFIDFTDDHAGLPAIITSDTANVRLAFWEACSPTSTGVAFHGGDPGDQVTLAGGCIVAWSSNTGDWGSTKTFTLSVYDFLPDA